MRISAQKDLIISFTQNLIKPTIFMQKKRGDENNFHRPYGYARNVLIVQLSPAFLEVFSLLRLACKDPFS